jgi:8-oxo-dGTP pyrophosphatase MutT (NUDIX family)
MTRVDAAVEPRQAATIALVRDRAGHVEVFLVRRHARSGFMANAYVFPGGRLDSADGAPALLARLGADAAAVTARMEGIDHQAQARAHLVAAVRETYEEAGILLATRASGEAVVPCKAWQDALNAGERTFESILVDEELVMNTDALAYFAHWVTPKFESRRYAARFFLAVAPANQEGRHDGRETTDSLWVAPDEALRRHAAGTLFLAPPQWQVLHDLAARASTSALLTWARGLLRVPPIQPHRFDLDGTLALALPGDPEHPETPDDAEALLHRIVLREGTWHHA